MKTTRLIRFVPMATALALAFALTPAMLDAQPAAQRGQRGPAAAEAPPARGAAEAEPTRRGPAEERGPGAMMPGAPGIAMPGGGPMGGLVAEVVPFWDRPMMAERLTLTEEQTTALKTSYDKARPAIDAQNTKMREAGQKIAETLNVEGKADLDALRASVKAFSDAQSAAMMAAVEHRATVQSTLNEEQLASLQQMQQRMRGVGPVGNRMAPGAPAAPGTLPDLPERSERGEPARREWQQRGDMTPEMREQMRDQMRERQQRAREPRGTE